MMELGEKRLRTVVEKANPKELVTLLDGSSSNMMDENFRMMVENIPSTVSTSKRRTWGRRANDGCNY
jgi:hypothetical protein